MIPAPLPNLRLEIAQLLLEQLGGDALDQPWVAELFALLDRHGIV